MELLEREQFLSELASSFTEARSGKGCVALVNGEAGIGKTSLVNCFTDARANDATVMWGACDALFTPQPLGALRDIAYDTRGTLLELIESETSRASIFSEFLDQLQKAQPPPIVVIEDAHWADESTLDLIKFLARRISKTAAMLIITYRDDEVGPNHPLQFVLGDLPHRAVKRLRLEPLSEAAVNELAERAGQPVKNLHAATGGNPFFVTEVLASHGELVPVTVRDAVLTRVARLSQPARELLELVSVVPAKVERWLLDSISAPAQWAVDECLQTGVLRSDANALAFRHELARIAVEGSLNGRRRQSLHALVLDALNRSGVEQVQLARLAHHAAKAGDAAAVLRFAPLAAREAAALSAHGEAAAHYQMALRYADGLSPEERARLLEGRSFECYVTDQILEAVEARGAALKIWEQLGRRKEQGDNLTWMSRLNWSLGRRVEAEYFAAEAVRALDHPCSELAMAYSNRAQLHMVASEVDRAVEWGSRAIDLATKLGDTESLVHALNNVGAAKSIGCGDVGSAELERSLELALANDLQDHAVRAFTNLGCAAVNNRQYEFAMLHLNDGIAYATDHDLDSCRLYMTAWRARVYFERGDWDSASDDANWVLGRYRVAPITRIPALGILGHVRVRRGDPGAASLLIEALELASPTRELQRIAPVALARAEAAWLRGHRKQTVIELRAAFELARKRSDPWTRSALEFWLWRAGGLTEPTQEQITPFALQIAGKWKEAADAWERLGCPYERAMALADGDEPAQLTALGIYEQLGATPASEALRLKLRTSGVRRVRRGPHSSTKDNPAGLTARQMDVLGLLAEGLSNSQIAEKLFISPKTVDHHISAILAKLDARTRSEAVTLAFQRCVLASK